jgi:hypothetical protein
LYLTGNNLYTEGVHDTDETSAITKKMKGIHAVTHAVLTVAFLR